jgi:hypothetical protein
MAYGRNLYRGAQPSGVLEVGLFFPPRQEKLVLGLLHHLRHREHGWQLQRGQQLPSGFLDVRLVFPTRQEQLVPGLLHAGRNRDGRSRRWQLWGEREFQNLSVGHDK